MNPLTYQLEMLLNITFNFINLDRDALLLFQYKLLKALKSSISKNSICTLK